MSTTLAIPTYNNPRQLTDTLLSLVRNTDWSGKVIVVNNGEPKFGGKPYYDFIQGQIPYDLDWIDADKNLGWMGGVNAALKHADSDFFTMCNDDVLFPPVSLEFWSNTLRWFDHVDVGGVGPASNYVSGWQNAFLHVGDPVLSVNYLIGFCATYRTKALRDIGGLDESLPGGDDIDLSIRMIDQGYHLLADRRTYLHHIGAQTGQRVHQGYWDSSDHQAAVYNAIIRKHGLKRWFTLQEKRVSDWSFSLPVNPVRFTRRAMQSQDLNLNGLYARARTEPSDVNQHLDILYRYASGCKVIVEFGVDNCTTTTAFLKARPVELHSYDINRHGMVPIVEKFAKAENQHFEFHQVSTLETEIPECDFLFIDDLHTYDHVKKELELHAGKARKYLAFHDTEFFGERGEDGTLPGIWEAIAQFLREHDEWRMVYNSESSNGLVILARV